MNNNIQTASHMKYYIPCLIALMLNTAVRAQQANWQGKFEQLEQLLPSPNEYRTGAGAPGAKYWQQQADYTIRVELDDINQRIVGEETITYTNHSPDNLEYLWLQLDQNRFEKSNMTSKTNSFTVPDSLTTKEAALEFNLDSFEGGYRIHTVKNLQGKPLNYTINATMMRINLEVPLKSKGQISFSVAWSYSIADRMKKWGRSGFEYFPEDGNYLYTIAQFFPRMCVYDDYEGWQNKQFLGQGEFALPFGQYKVKITVPADHIVAATGMLQNPKEVLSSQENKRFELAKKSFDKPVLIVTQEEAVEREKSKSTKKKTWEFHADNVRDFAFVSSRKFIWDAMAVKIGNSTPLAMSLYPKEGNPLWEAESTKAVKNTLLTYSKHTIDYPYPVAISVHTASIGMEYPMICFNYGRPNPDGTYSDRLKWGMIGVIIHEVGHNFFPMIINSDERQTTWMDEGINTFVQYLTEVEYYPNMPKRRGEAKKIVPYMKGNKDTMRPLMTNSEQIIQFGSEQYAKAATALNILRETVMGPTLFDFSFKTYAKRWAFKHPKPADFFRTMEDASAVDLDWFWRGWFYTTDHCDMSIETVRWFQAAKKQGAVENKARKVKRKTLPVQNDKQEKYTNFDNGPLPLNIITTNLKKYNEFRSRIDEQETMKEIEGKNFYEVTLNNKGGLIMPVILEWTYSDGSTEIEQLPAEIWRINEQKVTKTFVKTKKVVRITLDPKEETADTNRKDNMFPKINTLSKFDEMRKSRK